MAEAQTTRARRESDPPQLPVTPEDSRITKAKGIMGESGSKSFPQLDTVEKDKLIEALGVAFGLIKERT